MSGWGARNQIKYTLDKYSGDASKVFVTGSSSGGMATNALIATYPDVFAAGASFSGAPAFACWNGAGIAVSGGPDPGCQTNKKPTAQQWGELVRSAYPVFNGTRPAMQIWHGTSDAVVTYGYLADQLAEWSNVLGIPFSKNVTNEPESGYTKMVYGDGTRLVGYSAQGVGHIVPFHAKQVLEFFGLV
jgi:acetylxylan esterase